MINADGHGYYFTEYEPAAVAALARRDPPLTAPERISLLGDEWRIVRAGRHDIGTYLDLAAAFASDPTPEVAAEIAGRLAFVRGAIADDGQRPQFDAWVKRVFRPALDRIGIEPKPGDSDDVNACVARCCRCSAAIRTCSSAPARWRCAISNSPRPCRRRWWRPVLQVAAAGGDAALYDRYVAKMKASVATPEEYYRFFNALAGVPRSGAARSHAELRPQGRALTGHAVVAGATARHRRRQGVALRQGELAGTDGQARNVSIRAVCRQRRLGGCSAESSAELKKFFDDHPVPEAARGLAQAHERIASCVAVKERQSAAFAKWLLAL